MNVSDPDWQKWFEGKELTTDWVSAKLTNWFAVLATMQDSSVKVLEVGSYEGRSAIAFLEYLPKSAVTIIDTFEHADIEGRFDRNIAPYGKRLTKLKGRAIAEMDRLIRGNMKFDVIYLDAGKSRNGTFAQSALAWTLLSMDGVLIWDDIKWSKSDKEEDRPASGIRLFQKAFSQCHLVLFDDRQLIVRKTAEWPRI